MKIIQVRTINFSDFPNITMLEIETDAGIVGLGETYYTPRSVAAYIEEVLAPMLLDADPLQIEAFWRLAYDGSHVYGNKGLEMRCLSAVDVALSVLGVLSAAHEKGIVHRDLKPENVFLSADGIHVLDFGIAKITRTDGLQGLSTATGALLGTPHYMAPEQAFGEKDVDGRADLWALGVLLYECLSGTRPIEGDNLGQILRAMTECKSTPLLEVAPEVDPELAKVVDGLLVERSERPSDAALVSASLQALAGTLSGTVRVSPKPKARGAEATTAEPVTREAPRSRSRGGYVIGAVAVALGAWVVFPRAPRAHSLGRGLGQVTVAAVSAATVKSEVPEPPVEPKAVVPRVFRRVVQPKAPPSAEPPVHPARPDKLINEPPF